MKILLTLLVFVLVSASVSAAEFALKTVVEARDFRVGLPFLVKIRFLYDTCCIRAPIFSPLVIDGADVSERSDPEQFAETIAGTRFGVYQFHYTVTPRQQGTLTIPRLSMSGEQLPATAVFSAGDKPYATIVVESEAIAVQVRE